MELILQAKVGGPRLVIGEDRALDGEAGRLSSLALFLFSLKLLIR